jgi:hypothetical protein
MPSGPQVPADWLVAIDDAICARLRACTVCGRRADVLDLELRRVGRLAIATARCRRCRDADPTGQALTALLAQRYGAREGP